MTDLFFPFCLGLTEVWDSRSKCVLCIILCRTRGLQSCTLSSVSVATELISPSSRQHLVSISSSAQSDWTPNRIYYLPLSFNHIPVLGGFAQQIYSKTHNVIQISSFLTISNLLNIHQPQYWFIFHSHDLIKIHFSPFCLTHLWRVKYSTIAFSQSFSTVCIVYHFLYFFLYMKCEF